MKLNVLVTGSAGFLAGHLISRLGDCDWAGDVAGLDNRADGNTSPGITADITDPASVEKALSGIQPDVIFHLCSPPPSAPLEELCRVNVAGTQTLLAALARLETPPRVLVAGSAAEYGYVEPGEMPVKEGNPLRPHNNYGISKAAQTMLCAAESRRLGLPVIVFRPFNIVGPGMPVHLAFGSFARRIARAERDETAPPIKVGRLDGWRDFVDVRDVAEALCLLAVSGRDGETYNICTGELHSVREGLEIMLDCAACRLEVVEEKPRAARPEPPDFAGDPSMIRAHTGWTPSFSFEQSVRDLFKSITLRARPDHRPADRNRSTLGWGL